MEIKFESLKTPSSLERVRKIASSIWPETFREILSREQIAYMMEMMYAPSVMEKELENGYDFTLLLTPEGEDGGYMVTGPAPGEPGAFMLHKLYLLSRHHGKGWGSAMLEQVEKMGRERGYKKLTLHVNRKNFRAYNCYCRNGFTVEKELCTPIGKGFVMDDYIMVKDLG